MFDGDSLGLRNWTLKFASLLARSNIDRRAAGSPVNQP